ncbi:hypothetical protein [Planotetraspora silvatica]|nr:hypothetical protein [Planotetraspora silvatica]
MHSDSPVVLEAAAQVIHGLCPHATSWQPWIEILAANGHPER